MIWLCVVESNTASKMLHKNEAPNASEEYSIISV